MKFHVNDNGDIGKCSAMPGNCPYASDADHFSTAEAARESFEKKQSFNSVISSKKTPVKLVNEVINDLQKASALYYSGHDSHLTDEEFDAKQTFLQEIMDSGQHSELFKPGTVGHKLLDGSVTLGANIEITETVKHSIPMLSLAKAKKETDLYSFLDKTRAAGAKGFRLQAKLDGLAISVHYNDKKITRIVTRGDGNEGEDVTYIIDDSKVTVEGLPNTITEEGKIEVRGELFFSNDQFQAADKARFEATGEKFKNSRNSVTGLLKKAKLGVDYPITFTYAAYSVIENNEVKNLDSLSEDDGFVSVDSLTESETPGLVISNLESNKDVMDAIHKFGEQRPGFNIPTDGVVIKPMNEGELYQSMGTNSHHPVSQIAWKYPAETAQTTILKIDMTVGKTGRVTPIARIEPVLLDGSEISNASLHNFNLIHSKNIRVGSIVLIEKANDIIPQVKTVLSNPSDSVEFEVPTNCPSCGGVLFAKSDEKIWPPKTLNCRNDNCESRDYFALKAAVGKNFLDIDKLSDVTLNHFHEIGRIKNISDLYTLTHRELAESVYGYSKQGNPRRLGGKIASHILHYLELSKTRPIEKVLPALNIDSLGRSSTKKLIKRFRDLDGLLNASEHDISTVDGIGQVKAKKIFNGLKNKRELIDSLRSHGVEFAVTPQASTRVDNFENDSSDSKVNAIQGKSFTISGTVPTPFNNRNEWVDYIEANGGEFHSGPKANTDYIIGDENSTSSKIIKAKKLGITFMNSNEFTNTFV